MASLSDYQLFWSGNCSPGSDAGTSGRQYVFETCAEQKPNLRRVRSFQDAVSLLSGSRRSADWFAVAGVALLYGNLAATGQWWLFVGFAVAGLLAAVLELRAAGASASGLLAGLLLETLRGGFSLHWLVAVGIQILLALATLIVVLHLVQEDPRSYVLLREGAPPPSSGRDEAAPAADAAAASAGGGAGGSGAGSVVVRNRCCMDVKLLIFDGDDFVRLVPQGGLLGGTMVERGATFCVGSSPPYVVKAYAPWEIELGTFVVGAGTYSLRATAPPLVLLPGEEPRFLNDTEEPVRICACRAFCWCCSLWLPFAPQLARLARGTTLVPPGADVALGGPCTLRVYGAGLLSGILQLACCHVRAGERAEFVGSMRWTPARGGVGKSCSSLFGAVS